MERYTKMLIEEPENTEILDMINNYNKALSHPNEDDIDNVQIFAKRVVSEYNE